MVFWNCTLRWVRRHRLRRWIFLNCIMFLKFHIHTIHIKASIFKILMWNNEEIVLLNKYYKVFYCPMFQLGKMFRSKREIAINLLENKGNKDPLHHMENKVFYSHLMQRKNRLVRDTLAVYIWLEEISSTTQKHWSLTKLHPSCKRLR